MTGFAEAYNNVRQKEAADQIPCAFTLGVWARSWFITPQLTTKSRLSNGGRRAGDTRENELTEESYDSYRGKNTHEKIPIVDVIHSINLSGGTVSDHSGTEFGWRAYYYHVRDYNLERKHHKPNDPLCGKWWTRGQVDRGSRGVQDRSYGLSE